MIKVLVTTASFGGGLGSTWVPQKSNKYEISYNRVTGVTESERVKAMHPRLRAKMPKMIVWEDKPGYDYYIWLDSRFSILDELAVERLVDECIGVDACFFKHCGRSSVNQEVNFVLELMNTNNQYLLDRYKGERMKEQVEHYSQDVNWKDDVLFECGIFIYSKKIIEDKNYNPMKEWFYHNCLWSIQDQLSLPYLVYKFNINYKILPGNVYDNKYFK
jgi:hypothetical protein